MKKMISLSLGVILMLGILAGCGGNNEIPDETGNSGPVNLVIISGVHGNSPRPAVSGQTATEAILNSTSKAGQICLIVNDGKPFAVANYQIKEQNQSLSRTKREQVAQELANQVIAVLNEAAPVTPEVDTMASLHLAARAFSDSEGQEKVLLIMDSGLSTSGYVDFTQNLLRANSNAVVEYLQNNNALPDLSDVSVVWAGLGDVAGDQEPLTPTCLQTLKEIWLAVLYSSGASSVEFSNDLPSTQQAENELPYVTPVQIMQDEPFEFTEAPLEKPLVLDEEKILFLPDSAEFADLDSAKTVLEPIADYISSHPDYSIVVAGTTATVGSNESCVTFSRKRADAVEALLISLGAEEGQIATIGLGYDHKYHIPDLADDGSLNKNASANRSVIIFDASTEEAQTLLEAYDQ